MVHRTVEHGRSYFSIERAINLSLALQKGKHFKPNLRNAACKIDHHGALASFPGSLSHLPPRTLVGGIRVHGNEGAQCASHLRTNKHKTKEVRARFTKGRSTVELTFSVIF